MILSDQNFRNGMFAHGDSIFIGDEVLIANGSQRGALFHYQKVDGVWTSMGFITADETLEDAWELGREVVVEGSRFRRVVSSIEGQWRLGLFSYLKRATMAGSP